MKTSLTFLLLSLSIIASGQVPEYVPQDGLLALFPLSGNASNLVDDSFESDYINVEFIADEQDSCGTSFARFDAVLGSQINLNNLNPNAQQLDSSFCLSNDFTIAFDAKRVGENMGPIFARQRTETGSGLNLAMSSTELRLYLNNDQNDCGTDCAWETTLTLPEELQAASDEWLQVVTSRSGDLVSVYLNGNFAHLDTVELGNGGSLMCSSFQPTMIGKEYANGGWWTGDLKNLALWERAISAQEVSQWVGGGCNCSGAMLDECGECAGDNSSCSGCTDDQACNFDEEATLEDGSCFYFSVELPALCLESDSMMATAMAVGIDLTFGAAAEAIEGYQFIGQSDSSRYYLSDESYNPPSGWDDQELFAQSHGGHLADIHSLEENQFIFDNVTTSGIDIVDGYWLGFSDYEEEGTWTWTSGAPVTFTAWLPYEPNNTSSIGEHWAHMVLDQPKWNDHRSTLALRVLIELPVLNQVVWSNGEVDESSWFSVQESEVSASLVAGGVNVCEASAAREVTAGCNDPEACNYNPEDECTYSCIYAKPGAACPECPPQEECGLGTYWDDESQSCMVLMPSDVDFDQCVGMNDLLGLLSAFGVCLD